MKKMITSHYRNVVIKTSRSQSQQGLVLFFSPLSREPLVPPRWCSWREILMLRNKYYLLFLPGRQRLEELQLRTVPDKPLGGDDTETLAPDLHHLHTAKPVLFKDSPEQGIADVWRCFVRPGLPCNQRENIEIIKTNLSEYFRVSFLSSGQNGIRIRRLPMPRFLRWSSSSFLRLSYLSITSSIVHCSWVNLSCRLVTCRQKIIISRIPL